ncbi:hypothetical protein Pint_19326 [Pistacia integerrima]|uniref:Uncharacterized protein n=1 Tax=Pistacia integerrima TaxID=434235 RepID=A0ACC0YZM1_9ROSI|nr:hypothetical protein Pint_19326 [Pistacia integerrima]
MDKKKIPFLPSSLNPLAESLDPVIFREGLQVQEQMNLGNYLKALQMVRKSISTHQHSPHLLYLESVALQFLAKTAAKDSKEMVTYLDKAYQSAKVQNVAFHMFTNYITVAIFVFSLPTMESTFLRLKAKKITKQVKKD